MAHVFIQTKRKMRLRRGPNFKPLQGVQLWLPFDEDLAKTNDAPTVNAVPDRIEPEVVTRSAAA